MDPAGLAPASSGVNADMLTMCTTGPDPRYYYKTKELLLQGILRLTPNETRNARAAGVIDIILPDFKNLSS